MNVCLILRRLSLGLILLPLISIAARDIPMNEINIHAYRHFHKDWPSVTDEKWNRAGEGYVVSFTENKLRNKVYFNQRGGFLCAMKFYGGTLISAELRDMIQKKYSDYLINVVTEITDGEKTLYVVKIENRYTVKTLSIIDGKLEVTEDLINGGINGGLTRN